MRAYDQWLEVVLRDFAGTPAGDVDVRVIEFDPRHLRDMAMLISDPDSWVDPDDPNARRLLLKIADNVTSLDEAADPRGVAVQIASLLQDFVIDETGRPWPEVIIDGAPAVVDAGRNPDGVPSWLRGTVAYRAIGQLRGTATAG
jgi:hypothetical protein